VRRQAAPSAAQWQAAAIDRCGQRAGIFVCLMSAFADTVEKGFWRGRPAKLIQNQEHTLANDSKIYLLGFVRFNSNSTGILR
jgi:hypothetical protein